MNRIICTAILASALLAAPAAAAPQTFTASYTVTGIPGSLSDVFGSFVVTLDPDTIPYVNDAVPSSASFSTAGWGYDEAATRIDFFPFSGSEPGFLVGAETGGLDSNNALVNDVPDFRIRFILNPDYMLISARGALRYGVGVGGGAPFSTFGFDTAQGIGVATWTVTLSGGGTPAIPEPATWGLMIAGFGLVGGALRRRRTPASFLA